MSPRAAAAALTRGVIHPPQPRRARTRPAPAPTRRRSGGAVAPPRRPTRPRSVTPARTKVRPRVERGALARPDFVSLLDRLLRGPAYIALVGVLLTGIVFFNVGVLQLNHGIARTDVRTTQLERENAALTQQLAKLASSERIQRLAITQGLVLPEPGDVRYLRANPGDDLRAARLMTPPDTQMVATTPPALVTQTSKLPETGSPQAAGAQPVTTPTTTPVQPTTGATPTTTATQPTGTTTPAPTAAATATP